VGRADGGAGGSGLFQAGGSAEGAGGKGSVCERVLRTGHPSPATRTGPPVTSRDLESRGPGPGCRKGAATLPPVSIQHRAMRCGTPPRAPPLCPRAAARCGKDSALLKPEAGASADLNHSILM
jgi:hypothetical protein